MITDFNKVFTKNEMKKLKASYQNKNILEIIETFRLNCELIKNNILDTKLDTESKFFYNINYMLIFNFIFNII